MCATSPLKCLFVLRMPDLHGVNVFPQIGWDIGMWAIAHAPYGRRADHVVAIKLSAR